MVHKISCVSFIRVWVALVSAIVLAGDGGGSLSVQRTQGADRAYHRPGAVPNHQHADRARGHCADRARGFVLSRPTIFLREFSTDSSLVGGGIGVSGGGGGSLSVQWTQGADRVHHGMGVVLFPLGDHFVLRCEDGDRHMTTTAYYSIQRT